MTEESIMMVSVGSSKSNFYLVVQKAPSTTEALCPPYHSQNVKNP